MVGRDAEIGALVAAWLATPPQPTAVLGPPGIGKSAVCLAALHDERVRQRFGDRRWFIRCDGTTSAEALLSGLAAELGVIADGSGGTLLSRVSAVLADGLAVVVLDNFETPWTADPLPVEDLLRAVAAIPQAGVTVSARGTARPAGLRWHESAMLTPLPLTDARRVFLAVAGTGFATDPQLDQLLAELDGVPLAVELLGYAAQGQPNLSQVAQRWRAERVGMLARMGGGHRELSVAVSVEASIAGPLVTPPAARLLALLGVLPDGITSNDLAALLPDDGLAGAAVLRQLGLAFDEGDRLRMLAPIRDHAASTHPPGAADLASAVSHYAQFAATTGSQVGTSEGSLAITRLQAESGNITAMLEQAAADRRTEELANALWGLTEYWKITEVTQPGLASAAQAAVDAYGTPDQRANMGFAFGDLAVHKSDLDGARAQFERALPFYQQTGSVQGEAHCILGLGNISLMRSDYDGAQSQFERALALYRQAGFVLGEANCIVGLADINLDRAEHDVAQDQFERALAIYRQDGSLLGEASCIRKLGSIALLRADYEGAKAQFERALPLFQQAGHLLGEADCIMGLGETALARSDLDGASSQFERALLRYEAIPHPYSMGRAHLFLARLGGADSDRARHWTAARQLWASIGRDDLVDLYEPEFP